MRGRVYRRRLAGAMRPRRSLLRQPVEAAADPHVEVRRRPKTQEACDVFAGPDADAVAACEVLVGLAVDAHDRVLAGGDLDLDARAGGRTRLLAGARCGATGVSTISRDSGCRI